ncbi:MAG: hypothetical protein EOP49_51630, partial [Sphingobacteriales bacterium]
MKHDDRQSKHYPKYAGFYLWLAMLCLLAFPAAAQKYNFINFTVENGLAQSQVTSFAQNSDNELLVGTYGGLSIFDGSNFVNYNKSNGLPQNLIKVIGYDQQQNIWLGTNNGICRYDGKQFKTYYPSAKAEENVVQQIECDAEGTVWAFVSNALYRFDGKKFIEERKTDTITALTLDPSGKLWAVAYAKGIYIFNKKQWKREVDLSTDPTLYIEKMDFGTYSGSLYTFGNRGLEVMES